MRHESMARQHALASRQESQSVAEARMRSMQSRQAHEERVMQQQMQQQQVQQQQQQQQRVRFQRQISDDMSKKVADVRMMPWTVGPELDEAQSASARARQRILDLERELEEVTKKALTTRTHAARTAKALAQQAMAEEDALASSYKKSKKVMIESSSKMATA